jgi:hypothetical protein
MLSSISSIPGSSYPYGLAGSADTKISTSAVAEDVLIFKELAAEEVWHSLYKHFTVSDYSVSSLLIAGLCGCGTA